ncbi:MAG: hypothetical protein QOH74_1112 [Gaiellales bacterium]|jgi:hypothetical protein|nr:hypothetical protein [Gaiellales bacterium]
MSELEREETVFVRLDAPAEITESDDASVFASYIPVANDETESLLYDPLAFLQANAGGVPVGGAEDGWSISVTRLNTQFPLPRPPHPQGPHHHVCLWLVLSKVKTVHLVTFRAEPPAKQNV